MKEPAPYCLMCSTMGRMTATTYGFKCEGVGDHFGRPGCGNEIGHDFKRRPNTPGPQPPRVHNHQLEFYMTALRLSGIIIDCPPGTGKALSCDKTDDDLAAKTGNPE